MYRSIDCMIRNMEHLFTAVFSYINIMEPSYEQQLPHLVSRCSFRNDSCCQFIQPSSGNFQRKNSFRGNPLLAVMRRHKCVCHVCLKRVNLERSYISKTQMVAVEYKPRGPYSLSIFHRAHGNHSS
jgi:hypothetical protein